jgi:hypothetical protein
MSARLQPLLAEQYFSETGSWIKEISGNPLSEGKPPFFLICRPFLRNRGRTMPYKAFLFREPMSPSSCFSLKSSLPASS